MEMEDFASSRINDGCFQGVNGNGYGSSSSLVLDKEKGELVEGSCEADGKPAYERIFGDKSGSSEKNNGLTCKIGILWNFGNIQLCCGIIQVSGTVQML